MYWNDEQQHKRHYREQINRNMRCIEILLADGKVTAIVKINRNMRCIEIPLIEYLKEASFGLIETWDVLKFVPLDNYILAYLINRNMRCIEI